MAKEQKKPKSKARKIASWITTGIFVLLVGFVLTVQIVSNVTKKDNHGVPIFGDMQISIVLTDSMETKYMVGSAVFVKKFTVNKETVKEGDDLMFYYEPWKGQFNFEPVVTHQVVSIVDNTQPDVYGDAKYVIKLHGINKDSENCYITSGKTKRDCTDQYQYITEKDVMGKVVYNSKFVGGLYSFVTSVAGLIVLLGIPALYLIITSCIDLYKGIKEAKTEAAGNNDGGSNNSSNTNITVSNDTIDKVELSEDDKKRLKEELLKEMLEKKKK